MKSGTYGETVLHPLGLIAVFLLVLFALFLDRRKAITPLFIAAAGIPVSERLVILGADFTMLRILIIAYFARVAIRGEFRSIGWNRLDTAMLVWSICGTTVTFLAYGTLQALVGRLGWSFDMLGIYFVGRLLIRSWSDVKLLGSSLAVLSLPVAILFAIEWAAAYNIFSIFGGIRADPVVRAGRLRCSGAFGDPILAGTFWAASLPLVWTLRKDKDFLMRLGTIGCLFIIVACSSSTPILSVLVAVICAALFPWRRHRTKMWIGLFALLTLLHVVREKPVWSLMQRVDFTGGSTGYWRYQLFDAFVKNFSKWYLLGEPDPLSWGLWVMEDVTNTYVAQGLTGGLLTLVAFLLVLTFAFGNVGRALNVTRSLKRQWICWCIGVAISVNAVTFLGVMYYGQMIVILYVELSLASSVYVFAKRDARKQRARNRVLEAQRPRGEIVGVSSR
jgi:hypothetical protein